MKSRIAAFYKLGMGRCVAGALLIMFASLLPFVALAEERVYFYHNDHLGSPVAVTDVSGNVVWKADYEPFGTTTTTTETVSNTHQFTGKEVDSETGLHYFGARYYDPGMGRFLSVDPLFFSTFPKVGLKNSQRLNLYSYGGNNPINRIELLGLWYVDINVSGGYIIGGTGGVLLNDTGVYPYVGGGLTTPGISGSITYSPSDPTTGWNAGFQGTAGLAGQVGYSFGEGGGWFTEVGIGWGWPSPFGASLTGYYVFNPWTADINETMLEESLTEYYLFPWSEDTIPAYLEESLTEYNLFPWAEDTTIPESEYYLFNSFENQLNIQYNFGYEK